ncbi:MAG: aldehyde:ferredoxin oxidoreductase [Oscillospiraceae bacterium]|nr:aldehyde:ferredoxin oxidoreductase [Oscillospiraceae bacterium]
MLYQNTIRVLYIDMKTQKIRIEDREDLKKYMGGVGVASKLLEENIHPELPPLDPAQPVVFAIGALSTIYPVLTKTVAMFISPLTGELGESYAGGRMAMCMFLAGIDAIVIHGKADRPTYLAISSNDIQFKDARTLWNNNKDSVGRLIRDDNKRAHGGKRSIIRIGTAGENQVSFACVTVDRYRHFGRLGLGAVLGSKYLKAISIVGDRSVPIQNFKRYFKAYQDLYKKCVTTELMAKYHDIGTPVNIEPLNAAGGLPTLNLRQNRFEHANKVSGEAFSYLHLVRKVACTGCPVGCIHIGQFKREFASHGHEYETISVAYDYELIYALGTFLGIKKPREILELIEEVEILGMDAMSTGVVLGWATEALENGIITQDDTIVPLKFGSYEEYLEAVKYLAAGKNKFYKSLGQGVKYASEAYGGQDYAMHIAGNEMAGYHTGYGSLVGSAVAARHSHLCNGGYAIDQGLTDNNVDPDEMAQALLNEEIERCMLNSLVMCLFARKVYDRETIISAFAAVGEDITDDELTATARRIYATKLRVKKALGFKLQSVRFPKRFFETPSMRGVLDENMAYEILKKYHEKISDLETAE